MVNRCCLNCVPPKRHPKCHDTCEEYQKEKAERDARKAKETEEKNKYYDANSYFFDRERKVSKHFGRK